MSEFPPFSRGAQAATMRYRRRRRRRTVGQNSKKGSKTSTIHSSNSWIFLSKNPERVDCGGIFISKFFKKNQKLAEINEKSSDPLKRG